MAQPSPAAEIGKPLARAEDRAFPPVLMILTVITGLVDAVSYLGLGHVFVANMTGNVVFLGFAATGVTGFSVTASLVAIAAFLVGASVGGRVASRTTERRAYFLTLVLTLEFVLVAAALLAAGRLSADSGAFQYPLIALLAIAMGLQNAAARTLAVPDLTTTVLTLTLTGIAADSSLAAGTNPRLARRALSVGAMFGGALLGALLAVHWNMAAPLGVAIALLALAAGVQRYVQSRPSVA